MKNRCSLILLLASSLLTFAGDADPLVPIDKVMLDCSITRQGIGFQYPPDIRLNKSVCDRLVMSLKGKWSKQLNFDPKDIYASIGWGAKEKAETASRTEIVKLREAANRRSPPEKSLLRLADEAELWGAYASIFPLLTHPAPPEKTISRQQCKREESCLFIIVRGVLNDSDKNAERQNETPTHGVWLQSFVVNISDLKRDARDLRHDVIDPEQADEYILSSPLPLVKSVRWVELGANRLPEAASQAMSIDLKYLRELSLCDLANTTDSFCLDH